MVDDTDRHHSRFTALHTAFALLDYFSASCKQKATILYQNASGFRMCGGTQYRAHVRYIIRHGVMVTNRLMSRCEHKAVYGFCACSNQRKNSNTMKILFSFHFCGIVEDHWEQCLCITTARESALPVYYFPHDSLASSYSNIEHATALQKPTYFF